MPLRDAHGTQRPAAADHSVRRSLLSWINLTVLQQEDTAAPCLPQRSLPLPGVALLLQVLLATSAVAQDQSVPAETGQAGREKGFFGLGWLDQTQAYSTSRADTLAMQLDRFFGVERSDLEAAYSSLRLIPEIRLQEGDSDMRLRLRGRLHLPRIDERLSLIFSEDQGEGTSYYTQNPIFDQPQSTRVNMEVKLREKDKYRFDFRVGLRSSFKLRTSVRFRYESDMTELLNNRLSQTFYFIDGKGYGSFTQYQLDRDISDDSLLRWSTEYRHEENLPGDEWSTSLSYLSRLDVNGGLSYFARVGGTTDQNYVGIYQVGFRLRQNIARPWLFWEISPGYQWEKTSTFTPRNGGLFAILRLEMAIGRLE
jgi:hypothetical protein